MRLLIFCKRFNIKFVEESYCIAYRPDLSKCVPGWSTLRICRNCVNCDINTTEILR